jgi:hypothetical protein
MNKRKILTDGKTDLWQYIEIMVHRLKQKFIDIIYL